MKESVQRKLESLTERFEEVQALVSQPEIIADQDKYRALTKEYSQLEGVVKCFADYQSAQQDFESAQEMMQESDPEMREMAQEEYKSSKLAIEQ